MQGRLVWLLAAMLLAAFPAVAATVPINSRSELGVVRLARPAETTRALLFLYSDTDGWTPALDAAAERLAADGIAVVGVDLPAHLRQLARSDAQDCLYLVSAIEGLSKQLQKELGVADYRSPILAGVGAGGTLAYAALAQAPQVTVEGAVSLDPSPTLATRLPLCEGAPATASDGGFAYGRRDDLPGWWRIARRGPADPYPFADAVPAAETVAVPADADLVQALVLAIEPAVEAINARDDAPLADLPIIALEPQGAPTGLLAIILSGDGGWRDLDRQIGGWLAERGTGVVGIDSLRYFWTEKRPDRIAADLQRIIDTYLHRFHAKRTVLIGYSFGADVLPATWHAMPPSERDRVVQVSLLGLSPTADFEFHVGGWLGLSQGSRPVGPDVATLDLARVQCFYGREEDDSFCRDPLLAGAERIETKGGHHFDGDYASLARRILEGARRRLVAAGP
jgi:type IV secretory pathway VirJ component